MAAVLVVEDDADTRGLLVRWLAAEDHDVADVGNAEDALALLRERQVDLVVVDVQLPGMSGYELIRRIRAEDVSAPRIAIASIVDEDDMPPGVEIDGWLSKPFTRRELQTLVEQALAVRPG